MDVSKKLFCSHTNKDLSSQCVLKLYTAWNTVIRILFNVPRDTRIARYLIESVLQCLNEKTMLASRCEWFSVRLLKQVLSFALDFFLIYAKMTITQFLAEIYFPLQMIVI